MNERSPVGIERPNKNLSQVARAALMSLDGLVRDPQISDKEAEPSKRDPLLKAGDNLEFIMNNISPILGELVNVLNENRKGILVRLGRPRLNLRNVFFFEYTDWFLFGERSAKVNLTSDTQNAGRTLFTGGFLYTSTSWYKTDHIKDRQDLQRLWEGESRDIFATPRKDKQAIVNFSRLSKQQIVRKFQSSIQHIVRHDSRQ